MSSSRINRVTIAPLILAVVAAASLIFPGPAVAGDSGAVAALLSVVLPGAGHIYAGETMTGLTLMSIYGGTMGLAIGTGPWTWEDEESGDPFFSDLAEGTGTSTSTKVIFGVTAAAATITWLYSVIDAPKAVGRHAVVPYNTPQGTGLRYEWRF